MRGEGPGNPTKTFFFVDSPSHRERRKSLVRWGENLGMTTPHQTFQMTDKLPADRFSGNNSDPVDESESESGHFSNY